MRTLKFARGKQGSGESAVWEAREYNGTTFVDGRIRVLINGEEHPTQKGITIRLSELREVAAWLLEAADELDAPEPRQRREGRTASTTGAGPELSAEEEARLF